ncbi:unnamed protein product [Linum trigynum]|uniref:Retrovirus-related Pol polyprotein from transposon TNT 1-94 n=1 Tax=Linum trigynum TaxID=586398 RepID=A0AAV2FWM8_9ROSI
MSCVETPQQNSRVERKHQHILNVARSLKFQSGLPLKFWSDFILHDVYLINRLPTIPLKNKTPYEILYGSPPDLSNLKVFGCLCYASTLGHNRTKFSPRAKQCVFLGFQPGIKGYKLFDLLDQKVFYSRDVVFHENIIPCLDQNPPSTSSNPTHNVPTIHTQPDPIPAIFNPQPHSNITNPVQTTPIPVTPEPEISFSPIPEPTSPIPASPSTSSPSPPIAAVPHSPSTNVPIALRKPTRVPVKPVRYNDYVMHASSSHIDKYTYPLAACLSYDQLSYGYKKYVFAVETTVIPTTFEEAVKYKCWRDAMNAELRALAANHTWDVVNCPPGKRPIGNKWVFTIKFNPDGSIERYKARLVAKGFTQIYGVDFLDTYSPVAKLNSVKTLLAIASAKDWALHQLDVSNAFLHGDLEEEVYMDLPPGISDSGQVCRLRKSLYGLKQASRQWFAKLTSALLSFGYTQSNSDYSMFIHHSNSSGTSVLLVYVDDIIIAGDDVHSITALKQFLHSQFKIRDLGNLHYFLGLEIARSKGGMHICQKKYCIDLLKDTGYADSKPVITPINMKTRLSSDDGPLLGKDEGTLFRKIIGRLHYLTITRPDLTFAVQQLCQYQAAPTSNHLQLAYRILKYLKNAPGQGLFYPSKSDLQLRGYSDSDWASCPDTRRSTTGYCVSLGRSLIIWKSKKQGTVSRSSSEAEYRALAQLTCEVVWVKRLLHELHIEHPRPVEVYCDNRSAIYIAENPVFHERTKHIEVDCHVVRQFLQSKLIHLSHLETENQVADMFTKGLSRHRLLYLLSKLNIHNMYVSA